MPHENPGRPGSAGVSPAFVKSKPPGRRRSQDFSIFGTAPHAPCGAPGDARKVSGLNLGRTWDIVFCFHVGVGGSPPALLFQLLEPIANPECDIDSDSDSEPETCDLRPETYFRSRCGEPPSPNNDTSRLNGSNPLK